MFEYNARIRTVYDGDTLRADIDLGFGTWLFNQPIRLYGIDTPEMGSDAGKAAREFVRTLLPEGVPVTIKTYKDRREKYGRYLGTLTLQDGTDLVTRIIDAGHGVTYFGGSKDVQS